MRITCPSCASHFELPSELLGKKGRALKCATCQHAWYQAAQVEELDLAAIMGEEYAQKTAAGAGGQPGARPAAAAAQPAQQARAQQQQQQRPQGIQRVPPMPQNANQQRVQAAALGAPREAGRNVQAAPIRQQPPPPANAPRRFRPARSR